MSDRLKEQALEAGYGNGIGSQLLARIDELEAINQSLTASCDNTWHCACIVPLQKRIADLEIVITATMLIETELKVELAKISAAHSELERKKQMYINSTDRLTARIKELEAELAIAQAGPASKHPVRRTDSLRTNNEELFATWIEGE